MTKAGLRLLRCPKIHIARSQIRKTCEGTYHIEREVGNGGCDSIPATETLRQLVGVREVFPPPLPHPVMHPSTSPSPVMHPSLTYVTGGPPYLRVLFPNISEEIVD